MDILKNCCTSCLPKKKPTKFMIRVYFLTSINLFSSSFSVSMVYPFLPFMMEFLIPELRDDKAAVGIYTGIIGGVVSLGGLAGSYFWGIFADQKGRKPVIIIGGVASAIASLAFGFSVNFAMAVVTRCFLGLFFNGVAIACKAIISEVSDDSNQALGISVIGTAWGAGFILGPALSSVIADPIGQYNLTITNSFLHLFPYSPPCILSCLLYLVSTLFTIFFLPETLGMKTNLKVERNETQLALVHNERDDGTSPLNADCLGDEETEFSSEEGAENIVVISDPATINFRSSSCNDPQVDGSVSRTNQVISLRGEMHSTNDGGPEEDVREEEEEEEEEGKNETLVEIPESRRHRYLMSLKTALKTALLNLKLFFCDRTILTVIFLYSLFSFAVFGFEEIYPLWAYTPPHLGGLELSLHEIGISLTIVGVGNVFVSAIAFTLLEKYIGAINTFYLVAISLVFFIPLLPNIHYLQSINTWLLWVFLVTILFWSTACATVGFSSIFMFTNNSVTSDKLGSLNGASFMVAGIARVISPIILGSLFSLSLSDATLSFGFPADYRFVFAILSVVFLVCVFMVASLPNSINSQKIAEDNA